MFLKGLKPLSFVALFAAMFPSIIYAQNLNLAPDCSTAIASPAELWPANSRFNAINITGVSDPDGDATSLTALCITQDEPLNAQGDGNTEPDAQGLETDTPEVRAERQGGGDGRVYHLIFQATDTNNTSCVGEVEVGVPHNKNNTAVDSGSRFESAPGGNNCDAQPFNNPPIIVSSPVVEALTRELYQYLVQGHDPDRDALSYELAGSAPIGMVIDAPTGLIQWTPTREQAGTHNIEVTVTDARGLSAPQTYELLVELNNQPPVGEPQQLSVDEDNELAIELAATDPDGDDLTASYPTEPQHGVLSGDFPNLTYTPNLNYHGADSFSYQLNDGEEQSPIYTIDITINLLDDLDGDGIHDTLDADRDGDGVENDTDAFPNDPTETSDLDGDGIGDNSDEDRDGDSVNNIDDAFPNDPTETSDLDDDGIGDNVDEDRDGDGVDNSEDHFPNDPTFSSVPTVVLTSPQSLSTFGVSQINVVGTVSDNDARLTVNGVEVLQDGTFSAQVTLEEGANTVIVRAEDQFGHEGVATLRISRDTTPPEITIDSHENGDVVYTDTVTITGLVNDIVRGTITSEEAQLIANGISAEVSNRNYMVENLPLTEGDNLIQLTATDAVGNQATETLLITRKVPGEKLIEVVSGQSQSAEIVSILSQPLVIKLTDGGQPVSNKPVVFRVISGDGLLFDDSSEDQATGAMAYTDADGMARINYRLGSRAGIGNNRVRAKAVGFEGEAIFYAESVTQPPTVIGVVAGNEQRGGILQPLPEPLVVAVSDLASNLVAGVEVEFEASGNSGKFSNGLSTIRVLTDSDGRASTTFTLGQEAGLSMQRVIARIVGQEDGDIAVFSASAFVLGDPGDTSISGVILNNQDEPVPGVTVRVEGSSRQSVASEEGYFLIENAPVGAVHLIAEGGTATIPGEWPSISTNIVTVPGVDNSLPKPIYLISLDIDNAAYVGLEDVELTHPEIPGFSLFVEAGSVTFPDGSNEGLLSVTRVNSNKVPMTPPNGMQPQFVVTIQPHGAVFDPPAPMTVPNVDAHKPGTQVELFSYDHDLEEFVTIGLGTVEKNGATIKSNNGVGIVKAGWGCGGGSWPTGTASTHDCKTCERCNGAGCVKTPKEPAPNQVANNCQTKLCDGTFKAADDRTEEVKKCNICNEGNLKKQNEGQLVNGTDCEVCTNGVANNEVVDSLSFIAPPDFALFQKTINLQVSTVNSCSKGVEYSWNFGDGQSQVTTLPTTTHNYLNYGTYTVSVDAKCSGFQLANVCSQTVNLSLPVISIELITPAGDPKNAPVDSGTGQNEFTFDGSSGDLKVNFEAKVTPSTFDLNKVKSHVVFNIDAVGQAPAWSGGAIGIPQISGSSLVATATFSGLPVNNSSFGTKSVSMIVDSVVQHTSQIEVFFDKSATNHPGQGSGNTPNWYYYWAGTAVPGYDLTSGTYSYANGASNDYAQYNGSVTNPHYIIRGPASAGHEFYSTPAASLIIDRKGIDTLAATLVHEKQHLDTDLRRLPGGVWFGLADTDGDELPDSWEDMHAGYDKNNAFSFPGFPYGDDEEVWCEQNASTAAGLPSQDWANPGKQSKSIF